MGRDKSQKEISTGVCSFHFHGFFPQDRIKGGPSRKTWNQSKLANGMHIFHSEIPLGNFGLPFKKSRFPKKISIWGDHRRPKFTFRESEELLSIYSYKRHGCASWNVTFHLTRCLVTLEPLRI